MAQPTKDITLYEQQIKSGTVDPFPYDRLMIYYRKQKDLKKELQVINQALKTFTNHLKEQTGKLLKSGKSQATIKKLSAKFNLSSGLVDKKGNPKYLPEPLPRWTKRKQAVQDKLKNFKD
ncbi:hypothetical protein A4D02_11520 [Niastella koreensis]|uniref:Uncharacterized protein n=2 Tax=Niastella koreensis TaxID=354356 RepID=G8T9J8_NIAKG|nr:hypothetical protein [Niastella koreensis]AEV99188.1 hypothetical protein Niako_2854 [Niastella koreensis GR20-10]OQP44090.1 hypothetical protein A4D02_11520 [Niastella koreensis]